MNSAKTCVVASESIAARASPIIPCAMLPSISDGIAIRHSRSVRKLVDHWSVARLRDRFTLTLRHSEPGCLGELHLFERDLGCLPERGARIEVRAVRDLALIFLAIEDVDVIVLHSSLRHDLPAPRPDLANLSLRHLDRRIV